jgi:hypothetical protein
MNQIVIRVYSWEFNKTYLKELNEKLKEGYIVKSITILGKNNEHSDYILEKIK